MSGALIMYITPSSSQAKLSSKDVEAAYQKALEKIKGQDSAASRRTNKSILGAGDGTDPTAPGQVVTRNVDIFDFIPESVQNGFEATLISLLALNLLVIVVLGIGFTIEALPTSNLDLPEGVLQLSKTMGTFVEKFEKIFTPSLGVFFLLSSVLGSFKIAQLGKGATSYKEQTDTQYREGPGGKRKK